MQLAMHCVILTLWQCTRMCNCVISARTFPWRVAVQLIQFLAITCLSAIESTEIQSNHSAINHHAYESDQKLIEMCRECRKEGKLWVVGDKSFNSLNSPCSRRCCRLTHVSCASNLSWCFHHHFFDVHGWYRQFTHLGRVTSHSGPLCRNIAGLCRRLVCVYFHPGRSVAVCEDSLGDCLLCGRDNEHHDDRWMAVTWCH